MRGNRMHTAGARFTLIVERVVEVGPQVAPPLAHDLRHMARLIRRAFTLLVRHASLTQPLKAFHARVRQRRTRNASWRRSRHWAAIRRGKAARAIRIIGTIEAMKVIRAIEWKPCLAWLAARRIRRARRSRRQRRHRRNRRTRGGRATDRWRRRITWPTRPGPIPLAIIIFMRRRIWHIRHVSRFVLLFLLLGRARANDRIRRQIDGRLVSNGPLISLVGDFSRGGSSASFRCRGVAASQRWSVIVCWQLSIRRRGRRG